MPHVIQNFAHRGQILEVVRRQPSERENLEVGPPGKKHQKHDRKQKARNGIGHDDRTGCPGVKSSAIFHGLADPQRDRDQIGNQCRPKPERDRHRHFLKHQIHHSDFAKVTLAKIQCQIVAHHRQKPLQRRLVKAEFLFQLRNKLRRQPLRACVFSGTTTSTGQGVLLQLPGVLPCPGKSLKHVPLALNLSNHLLHRATGHKLNKGKVDDHDPQQRRDDQQKSSKNIGAHLAVTSVHQQHAAPQLFRRHTTRNPARPARNLAKASGIHIG